MKYKGKFSIFDTSKINTYPLKSRASEVFISNLIDVNQVMNEPNKFINKDIEELAREIISARKKDKPVIVFSGAHIIKNGMGPLLNSFIKKGIISALGVNGAFSIHDFELAYCGKTSENIPNALSEGLFGFAEETNNYINKALIYGNKLSLGYGESMGRFLSGEPFPDKIEFMFPESSVQYTAYKKNIPFCVHCAIGTDIYHMSNYFDGEAVGGCSGRDFLIFANEITKLSNGGVCLLIGSAVIGSEVILKAMSMAANIGKAPNKITTASFDMREANLEDVSRNNKEVPSYYFRDIKSIVTRIPQSFNGKGYYIKGNHKETLPKLYKSVVSKLS